MSRTLIARIGPVALWMAIIFFFSSQTTLPSLNDSLLNAVFKKSGHFAEYAVLMWLMLRAFDASRGRTMRDWRFWAAFGATLLYAVGDEFHQSFVPNRTPLPTDVVIDALGAAVGGLVWRRQAVCAGHSSNAWLYAIGFLACLWLNLVLNLPVPGKAPQDMSYLLKDPWFIGGFNYFGLLLTGGAALIIDDGARRKMRWLGWVIPYFVVGILPLSLYLARRPHPFVARPDAQPPRWLERPGLKWLWLALPVLTVVTLAAAIPNGSWAQLSESLSHSTGLWFMWLDIAANHVAVLPLVQADMRRRTGATQPAWLLAIALTGPFALGGYMAARPDATALA